MVAIFHIISPAILNCALIVVISDIVLVVNFLYFHIIQVSVIHLTLLVTMGKNIFLCVIPGNIPYKLHPHGLMEILQELINETLPTGPVNQSHSRCFVHL